MIAGQLKRAPGRDQILDQRFDVLLLPVDLDGSGRVRRWLRGKMELRKSLAKRD